MADETKNVLAGTGKGIIISLNGEGMLVFRCGCQTDVPICALCSKYVVDKLALHLHPFAGLF